MPRTRNLEYGTGLLGPADVTTRRLSYDELRPGEALVYRFVNRDWRCIYIGVTEAPLNRWRAHLSGKPWANEVAAIYYTAGLSRTVAWRIEREDILAERPPYNRTVKR